MFNIPITVPYRDPTGVFPVDLSIDIDKIVKVTPLQFDNSSDVEAASLYSELPSCELLLMDGRKLPIMETVATINRYLDLYQSIERFYNPPATGVRFQHTRCEKPLAPPVRRLDGVTEGVVVPLFGPRKCATSEASTPA